MRSMPPEPKGWLRSPFLQALLVQRRCRGQVPGEISQQICSIPLSHTTDLLLAHCFWQPTKAPAMVVVHGVGGSSASSYVQQSVLAGLAAGWSVIALNLRGVGAGTQLTQKLYHGGLIADLEDALMYLTAQFHIASVGLLGFSLGGSLALKLAARGKKAALEGVRAVAAISAPFDLAATARFIDSQPRWPYRQHLVGSLVKMCRKLAPDAGLPTAMRHLRQVRTLRAFDELVTAPMHGFRNADTYYEQASCGRDLPLIRTPSLHLFAHDDPVIPSSSMQPFRAKAARYIEFVWSQHGSHCGFFAAGKYFRKSWALEYSIDHLLRHLPASAFARCP